MQYRFQFGFKAYLTLFLMLLIVVAGCSRCSTSRSFKPWEKEAYSYIKREILQNDGRLLTYPKEKAPPQQDMSVWPNDVLAESMGLALKYFAQTGMKKEFDRTWWFVKNRMIAENGLVSWKFDAGTWKPLKSSAAIDDFRVARALFMAYRVWPEGKYFEEAMKLGEAIKKHEIVDGYPVEFYSWDGDPSASGVVDLSYLDLQTMNLFAANDPEWVEIRDKSTALVLGAFTETGLAYDKYEIASGRYINKENNLINKILCAIHLAEIGEYQPRIVKFIEEQIYRTGALMGRYNPENGQAEVNFSSAAVYALTLQFAVIYDRERLISVVLERLIAFQQTDKSSHLHGCFGYGYCHTFDTMLALLALSELDPVWFQAADMHN